MLRGIHDRLVKRFLASLDAPRLHQQQRLEAILEKGRDSAFGVEHQLSSVTDLDAFRAAVPIRSHADHLPWLERVAAGEPRVLTCERVRMLLETSGTTGRPKLLPVTDSWARGVADAQSLWVLGMVQEHEAIAQGRALTVISPAVHAHSSGGLPIGSNTGRMHKAQPWWLRARYPVPYPVFGLSPPDLRQYAILRFALQAPVSTITTANPSTILLLCRRLLEWREPLSRDLAAGTLRHGPAAALDPKLRWRLEWRLRKRRVPDDWRPASLWPLALVNCWTAGPASYFVSLLPEALGAPLPVREVGITASEGFFAIPVHQDWREACVLWTLGHLLEFIGDDGVPRWAWELERGERVRLIMTTEAGLYRYDIQDTLEVLGHCGRTPVVRFVAKAGRFLNATGEKVSEDQVAEAMRQSTRQLGLTTVGFTVRIELGEIPTFVLAVELPRDSGPPPAALAQAFDSTLAALNPEYASKRSSSRLQPARLEQLPSGTFRRYRAARVAAGAPQDRVKDPLVSIDDQEWQRVLSAAQASGDGRP